MDPAGDEPSSDPVIPDEAGEKGLAPRRDDLEAGDAEEKPELPPTGESATRERARPLEFMLSEPSEPSRSTELISLERQHASSPGDDL